ncbi:hypothetical protein HK097_006857, partial [Rhizophlyctis rosea]
MRTSRNRKQWDHKYEAGRKEAGTRGHGTNFEEEQKLRFPESNPPFITYAGYVDHLLKVLWECGRGQMVFSVEAVAEARRKVNGYKSTAGKSKWRVWLPDKTWAKFQILKRISAPANITHPEFAELLLDLAGIERKGHSPLGVRHELLIPTVKPEPQDLFFPTERQLYSPTPSQTSDYSSTTTITTDEMFMDLSAVDPTLGSFISDFPDPESIVSFPPAVGLDDESGLFNEIFGDANVPLFPNASIQLPSP